MRWPLLMLACAAGALIGRLPSSCTCGTKTKSVSPETAAKTILVGLDSHRSPSCASGVEPAATLNVIATPSRSLVVERVLVERIADELFTLLSVTVARCRFDRAELVTDDDDPAPVYELPEPVLLCAGQDVVCEVRNDSDALARFRASASGPEVEDYDWGDLQ